MALHIDQFIVCLIKECNDLIFEKKSDDKQNHNNHSDDDGAVIVAVHDLPPYRDAAHHAGRPGN